MSGPSLPEQMRYTADVQYGNTFALVGGEVVDSIYLFNPDELSWSLVDDRLSVAREDVVPILVSEDIFPACQ